MILTLGPPFLVGAAYALSYPAIERENPEASKQFSQVASRYAAARADELRELDDACRTAAVQVLEHLPDDCVAIVRTPFVLAGDLSSAELERLHAKTVLPVTEALWRAYFDRRPDQPVIIVCLRHERSYRAAAMRLDNYEPSAYAGYTQRHERRIVFNAATGAGTLSHELAHVLALFDFPAMPEWFDEGLASLHEQAEFSPDGLLLSGGANWRCRLLVDALHNGTLPELESAVRPEAFRGEGEGSNYALVRGLCLYLQERGLLSHFYRKFRANVSRDPSGLATLCELLGASGPGEVDRDFRSWIAQEIAGGAAQ